MRKFCRRALALVPAFALTAALATPALAGPFDEKRWLKTGDYDILYRVIPAEGAQIGRIFFIHGILSSTLYWEELAGMFSQAGYTCAMLDLPTFGESTRESKDVAPKDREEIIAELMEHLAPGERWIVAGHSMGGGVALNVAIMYPEKVSALLLYAPAAVRIPIDDRILRRIADPVGRALDPFIRPVLYVDPLIRLFAAIPFADLRFAWNYDISRVSDSLKLPGTLAGILHMAYRAAVPAMEDIARLELPILMLKAKSEYIVPASMQPDAAMPPQTVTHVMKGGHQFSEQYAAETFEKSMEFLSFQ